MSKIRGNSVFSNFTSKLRKSRNLSGNQQSKLTLTEFDSVLSIIVMFPLLYGITR